MKAKNKKILFSLIFILLLFISGVLLLDYAGRALYPMKYQELVSKYSERYDIDPYLVFAVIKVESSFRHRAVSPKNARGLMQITEGTGKWGAEQIGLGGFSQDMLFDPEANIQIGCWYLSRLYSEFGDTDLVIAAYNAGSGNVSKWLKNVELSRSGKNLDSIPFQETKKYLKKVKNSYKMYKILYENEF